jgi:hypothetical protein
LAACRIEKMLACPLFELRGIDPKELECRAKAAPISELVNQRGCQPDTFGWYLEIAFKAMEWVRSTVGIEEK